MSSCIICGKSVDGHICDLHEEDVVFEFRGNHPSQLTEDRYYRGTVDGFAEFGVFVDIGESVTGLLHRSELDQRLDSLDWEPGETVFVKVQNIRDNGNVDLAWSIRQDETEFRGTLVEDPEWDHARLAEDVYDDQESDEAEADTGNADGAAAGAADDSDGGDETTAGTETTTGGGQVSRAGEATQETATGVVGEGSTDGGESGVQEPQDEAESGDAEAETAPEDEAASVDAEAQAEASDAGAEPETANVSELSDRVGEDVRLEGEVVDVRQTSGPTVFEVRDETGTVDCAAFVEAGVRAYPDVVEGAVVRLDGEVRERRGEIQVETESLDALDGEERQTVQDRMADALERRARPDAVEPLAEDPAVAALDDHLVDAATAVRKAVITDRPVVVRHSATADGYVAGVALERATLPLIREEHRQSDAEYHYFDRRPLEGGVYDMDDATRDATQMLEDRERHDEKVPLFVFVAAGGTRESLDGFELLDLYDAPQVVVDDAAADQDVLDAVDTVVSPVLADAGETTATALAANVAAHVNDDVREDLAHLPAVSFWDDTPAPYLDAAAAAGYDAEAVRQLREAVALEAYYQSYEDKRQLVIDLLFGDDETDVGGLAANVAEQFRTKLDDEVDTANANLDVETVADATIAVLDTDAFTHRFDFPPETLLLDELYRRRDEDVDAVVGLDTDTLYVRGDQRIDVHALADEVAELVPDGGVTVQSGREQSIRFLAGERDRVRDATLDGVAGQL